MENIQKVCNREIQKVVDTQRRWYKTERECERGRKRITKEIIETIITIVTIAITTTAIIAKGS